MSIRSFAKKNASVILTCISVAGVVATTIMAVKETPKALSLLENAKEEKREELTKWEKVKIAGPVYIPSIITGVATIACICGSNVISKRQQTTLATAYALLDNSYKDYKKKVVELYGEEADREVKSSIAKDKYEETDVKVDDTKKLFFDFYSSRYFESTDEIVRKAEYDLNRELSIMSYASLNDFYDLLKIEKIDGGDDLGWSAAKNFEYYCQSWIDFAHEKVVMDDGLECCIIHIQIEPTFGYEEY